MTPTLEILIPVRNPDARLAETAASLVAQKDRNFEVRLSGDGSPIGSEQIEDAVRQLTEAGITLHRAKAPGELKRIEHWNWLHANAKADWLKPLLPGEILRPQYVERLRQALAGNPQAQLVRCEAEVQTDWGTETSRAPFNEARITAAQFGDYFPSRVEWICRAANVAYSRTAWLATGGYCPQLPGLASLNLNVTLALHHGLENIAETLVRVEAADGLPLNESAGERVNLPLELWLLLRQARNYCIGAKVPWRCQWPIWRAMTARMGRW